MLKQFCVALILAGTPSFASDFKPIREANVFKTAIAGKTLTRPLIKLVVSATGDISGTGAAIPVTGTWAWKDGYFCRTMLWGERDIGYNCQEVAIHGNKVRFQSDKGTGDYADFNIK